MRPSSVSRSLLLAAVGSTVLAGAAAAAAVALLGSSRARTAITHGTVAATHRLRGKKATMRPAISTEVTGARRTARTRSTDFPNSGGVSKPAAIGQSVLTGLVTAAAMILRDPRKMRAASNAFSAAAGYVRSRRSRHAGNRHAQVVHVKEG